MIPCDSRNMTGNDMCTYLSIIFLIQKLPLQCLMYEIKGNESIDEKEYAKTLTLCISQRMIFV